MQLFRQLWSNRCNMYCVSFASDVEAKPQDLSLFCDNLSVLIYFNAFLLQTAIERLEGMGFKQFAILRYLSRRIGSQLISNECCISAVNIT